MNKKGKHKSKNSTTKSADTNRYGQIFEVKEYGYGGKVGEEFGILDAKAKARSAFSCGK